MSFALQSRAELTELVWESARLLDERRFGDWLDLTAPEFRYRIGAYSPELRKEMTWLEHDRKGMIALIELLPKHHVDGADLLRHVSVGRIRLDGDRAGVTSTLALFRTAQDVGDSHIEGGSSSLFLIGVYFDLFRYDGARWLLSERVVQVKTRQLGVGSHLFP